MGSFYPNPAWLLTHRDLSHSPVGKICRQECKLAKSPSYNFQTKLQIEQDQVTFSSHLAALALWEVEISLLPLSPDIRKRTVRLNRDSFSHYWLHTFALILSRKHSQTANGECPVILSSHPHPPVPSLFLSFILKANFGAGSEVAVRFEAHSSPLHTFGFVPFFSFFPLGQSRGGGGGGWTHLNGCFRTSKSLAPFQIPVIYKD